MGPCRAGTIPLAVFTAWNAPFQDIHMAYVLSSLPRGFSLAKWSFLITLYIKKITIKCLRIHTYFTFTLCALFIYFVLSYLSVCQTYSFHNDRHFVLFTIVSSATKIILGIYHAINKDLLKIQWIWFQERLELRFQTGSSVSGMFPLSLLISSVWTFSITQPL